MDYDPNYTKKSRESIDPRDGNMINSLYGAYGCEN